MEYDKIYWCLACLAGSSMVTLASYADPFPVTKIHYVDVNSTGVCSPYASWETAAVVLQDAVDVAGDGDVVIVAPGVYDVGSRAAPDMALSRIVIKPGVFVQSREGPSVTSIKGHIGLRSVRCAYVGERARLNGFTLTGGEARTVWRHARDGGDLLGTGGGALCSPGGVISNCLVIDNRACHYGGGVAGGMVHDSVVISNEVTWGEGFGAGLYDSEAIDCLIAGNRSANVGGGASEARLWRCVIIDNHADAYAGGVHHADAYNCFFVGNSVDDHSALRTADRSTLVNCTVLGGVSANSENYCGLTNTLTTCRLTNALVAYGGQNATNADVWDESAWTSCTIMLTSNYAYVMDQPPSIASLRNPRLLPGSPLIDAGTNAEWKADAVDIDGEPRLNGGVDIGADEFWPEGLTGRLDVAILVDYTNAVVSQPLRFESELWGKPQGYVWNLGDGGAATNLCVVQHAYTNAGRYEVSLTTWNLSGTTACTRVINVK